MFYNFIMAYRGVFLSNNTHDFNRVFGAGRRTQIEARVSCHPQVISGADIEKFKDELQGVEYAFSTWGMPALSCGVIRKCLPSLKAVFYAAGSVQAFARPFFENGVRIFSAWRANAIPVAETVFAQIVLAHKGFFKAVRGDGCKHGIIQKYPGNYRTKTGLIACGSIGQLVAEKLKTIDTEVLVYDPFISSKTLESLNAKRAELTELFGTCDVISNHLPDLPQTVGMLKYNLFELMKKTATFINSGRGRQVVEKDLAKAMRRERGRTAILDVTYPEPPSIFSPLRRLSNVILTPHMNGSTGLEVLRMADYMIAELDLLLVNKPPQHEVTLEMLEKMA